jgi:hypothetical protein
VALKTFRINGLITIQPGSVADNVKWKLTGCMEKIDWESNLMSKPVAGGAVDWQRAAITAPKTVKSAIYVHYTQ